MSYHLEDDDLRSAYERQLESDRDPSQDEALLQALIETVANSDIPATERLKSTQAALTAMLKLKQERRKMDVETGQLLPRETAFRMLNAYIGVFMELVKENVPDSVLHYVTDMVPLRMYQACKDEEALRRLFFSKNWNEAQQQYEGENRQRLIEKIEHDRELNLRREQRLLGSGK
jgi:hypothetical protein